ncbi:MAG: hypothetical protein AAGC44_02245 [Planctomycetota bacterium]
MPRLMMALIVLAAVLSPALPVGAIVNGTEPDEDDTRFDAVGAFSRTAWLIENPGDQHVHNWYGNGVLIAPDVVLIAKHLLPNNGQGGQRPGAFSIRFRRHVDGSLGSRDRGAESYHQVRIREWVIAQRFDLALGILEEPVEHIQPVKLWLDGPPLRNRRAVLAGWGSVSPWQGKGGPRPGLRMGENAVSSRGTFLAIDSRRTEMRENEQGQRKAYYIDENAGVNMHDSGGSMFIFDDGGHPILMGIIATYSGGTYLPMAQEAGFPIEASVRGGAALLEAVKSAE